MHTVKCSYVVDRFLVWGKTWFANNGWFGLTHLGALNDLYTEKESHLQMGGRLVLHVPLDRRRRNRHRQNLLRRRNLPHTHSSHHSKGHCNLPGNHHTHNHNRNNLEREHEPLFYHVLSIQNLGDDSKVWKVMRMDCQDIMPMMNNFKRWNFMSIQMYSCIMDDIHDT